MDEIEGSSIFAEEGTAAHELSEMMLYRYLAENPFEHENAIANFFDSNKYASQEMFDHVNSYVDTVVERIAEANVRSADAAVLFEQRLDYSEWVPDGYGTGDVLIISDKVLEIIDLKYGKGVPVSAIDNSQLRLYGLGALNMYGALYDIETVRMTIVQPRLDSISTEEMTAGDLLQWAEDKVRPAAELALSDTGPFAAGEHCKFCKAKGVCRTRAFANLEIAKYDFREPEQLSVEEVADILNRVDELTKWAGDVKDSALQQATQRGVKFPGYKLVEGRSNRLFADKEAVIDTLFIEGYTEDQIHKPRELAGVGDLEKLLGKKGFKTVLEGLVIKPPGKPTLVVESDKRPEIANIFNDFEEEL